MQMGEIHVADLCVHQEKSEIRQFWGRKALRKAGWFPPPWDPGYSSKILGMVVWLLLETL